jgi:D-alanine transaminase
MPEAERIVFLNGQFLPRSQAKLDIEDRGAMFADGVYEVTRYYAGRPFAMEAHLARLRRSLAAIRVDAPADVEKLGDISDQLIARNRMSDAIVYWQVTRGSAPRRHAFPTLFAIAYAALPFNPADPPPKRTVILHEDLRWHHCSIKSLMLLPNVLARQKAEESGAYEAILHRGDTITEATATSVAIVRGGELWTHPANQFILGSITRSIVLELAGKVGVPVKERTYTINEMLTADEVLLMGTTTHVSPVVRVEDHVIADGEAGPASLRLHEALAGHIAKTCGLTTT